MGGSGIGAGQKAVMFLETSTGPSVAQRVDVSAGSKGGVAQLVEQLLCK